MLTDSFQNELLATLKSRLISPSDRVERIDTQCQSDSRSTTDVIDVELVITLKRLFKVGESEPLTTESIETIVTESILETEHQQIIEIPENGLKIQMEITEAVQIRQSSPNVKTEIIPILVEDDFTGYQVSRSWPELVFEYDFTESNIKTCSRRSKV